MASERNTDLNAATGRYLAFLDDDDVYLPGQLGRAVEVLERKEADFVHQAAVVSERRPTSNRGHSVPSTLKASLYDPRVMKARRGFRDPRLHGAPKAAHVQVP